MTPDALIEALDAAAEPSRELDAEIARWSGWVPAGINPALWEGKETPRWWQSDGFGLPAFTASVSDALALAERVAPHCRVMFEREHDGWGWAMVRLSVNSKRAMAFAPTPALALCIALLDASQTDGSKQGREEK